MTILLLPRNGRGWLAVTKRPHGVKVRGPGLADLTASLTARLIPPRSIFDPARARARDTADPPGRYVHAKRCVGSDGHGDAVGMRSDAAGHRRAQEEPEGHSGEARNP